MREASECRHADDNLHDPPLHVWLEASPGKTAARDSSATTEMMVEPPANSTRVVVAAGLVAALLFFSCSSEDREPDAAAPADAAADAALAKMKCAGPQCKTGTDCPSGYKGCVDGKCVRCMSDADCQAPFPYCGKSHLCVECTKDEHCKRGPGKCSDRILEGMCEECQSDADCPSGLGCEHFMIRCLTCKTDADCNKVTPIANFDFYGKHCRDIKALGIRACVKCTKDADCANARFKGCKIIAAGVGACTGCRSNEECCQGKKNCGLVCDAQGDCICATSQQCSAVFPGTWSCERKTIEGADY